MRIILLNLAIAFTFSVFSSCQIRTDTDDLNDRKNVEIILQDLDNLSLSPEEQLLNYHVDAVILAPDQKEIRGHAALKEHLSGFGQGVDLNINHEIIELNSFRDIVVAQGRVIGTAKPENDPQTYAFETKNLILFKRDSANQLKIWKVIYNAAPVSE